MSSRTLSVILGLAYIVGGILTVVFYRRTAEQGARFHQRVAQVLPWLYRIPLANFATSEKVWRPMAILGGLLFIAVGTGFAFDLWG